MSTTHTIPLAVIVRAAAALKAAKHSPVGLPLATTAWAEVNRSYSELDHHLEKLFAGQEVELSDD